MRWSGVRTCVNAIVLSLAVLPQSVGAASSAELLHADENAAEWLMYGRTYDNQRFSPLMQITAENVAELRPVWTYSLGTLEGVEATPLVDDGVMYVSSAGADVYAFDARNGRRLWHYTPRYEGDVGKMLCCGRVNRGVAIKDDLVYVATLDARLVALDKHSGQVRWDQRIGDWKQGVSSTGAPLVVRDKVVVGMAGGEYGVRGYLRAYHADYGYPLWMTYTVPGPGEPGHETWQGEAWKTGGGATWQTGAYDPQLNLLYWGTGNPAPWLAELRPGDNLWTSSLLALNPDTGRIVWGFQYTPHDNWDYDGNNAVILADLEIDGVPMKAALQSNRNGYFYVLDRTNGRFLFAEPAMEGINWAHGLDPASGRPTINEAMRPLAGKRIGPLVPSMSGGSNWFPMAYNPELGIAFVPSNEWGAHMMGFAEDEVSYTEGQSFVGMEFGMYRTHEHIGHLKAFDVVKRRWLWDLPSTQPVHAGVLATKSGLVFTGDQLGFLLAINAKTGEVLWRYQTGSGINASPISYEIAGQQYVAVLSGVGGNLQNYYKNPHGGMVFAFRLTNLTAVEAGEGEWSPEEIPFVVQPVPGTAFDR